MKKFLYFFVVLVCTALFMSACSDDNTSEKNDSNSTPIASATNVADETDSASSEATKENNQAGETPTPDSQTSVESPTDKLEATETEQASAPVASTDSSESRESSTPSVLNTPSATSDSNTSRPVTTTKPSSQATGAVSTIKPDSTNAPVVTKKPTVTSTPTKAPATAPAATASPTQKPVSFPVISAKKDGNYNSIIPTVVTVSETSTKITNSNGGVSQVSNGDIYIKLAGEYEFSGTMKNRSIIVQAPETDKVIINLKGLQLTTEINVPISILSADKVEISANKDTVNVINDNRKAVNAVDASGGAISAECDLEIKGRGNLAVNSTYNNGIFTKDDLEVKNLTLNVTASNNALKGNDSVTVISGNITLVALNGNGIETKNSDISASGKQRGNVIISTGNINIKAGNDGINAAYAVTVSAGKLIIEANDYSIDAVKSITISANANFTDKSILGCNPKA